MRSVSAAPLLSIVMVATLVGCVQPASSPSVTPSALPPPATQSPAPTPSPTSIPTATAPSCLSRPGRVIEDEYNDADLPRSIPYHVYLPPCYDRGSHEPLPVLLLLHGLQLTDSQWIDLGVAQTSDRLIRQGRVAPFIIVMPWERKGLDFEDALVHHLLPFIRETYAGSGDRTTTSIGGISRGAGWALRIGLKHPDVFGAIGLHSPAVLVPDMYWIPDWIRQAGPDVPSLWIDVATRDTSLAGAKELASLLDTLGVEYAWSSAPGEHSAGYWSSRLVDYLKWYAEGWVGR
jgi:enterochelin esterase-like enzyme